MQEISGDYFPTFAPHILLEKTAPQVVAPGQTRGGTPPEPVWEYQVCTRVVSVLQR